MVGPKKAQLKLLKSYIKFYRTHYYSCCKYETPYLIFITNKNFQYFTSLTSPYIQIVIHMLNPLLKEVFLAQHNRWRNIPLTETKLNNTIYSVQ